VAALLDGVDLVVAAPPGAVSAQVAARLTARARQRGGVLIAVGPWPGADLTLDVVGVAWQGLGNGRGRLRQRQIEVTSHGRGAATRARRAKLWLPGPAHIFGASIAPGPARAEASASLIGPGAAASGLRSVATREDGASIAPGPARAEASASLIELGLVG